MKVMTGPRGFSSSFLAMTGGGGATTTCSTLCTPPPFSRRSISKTKPCLSHTLVATSGSTLFRQIGGHVTALRSHLIFRMIFDPDRDLAKLLVGLIDHRVIAQSVIDLIVVERAPHRPRRVVGVEESFAARVFRQRVQPVLQVALARRHIARNPRVVRDVAERRAEKRGWLQPLSVNRIDDHA